MPKHSLLRLATRCVSQTTTERKIVITLKYSIITVTPQKMQKALMANIELVEPIKKAMASVRDVIVIEGPACCMPRLMRSEGGRFSGV